MPKPEEYLKKTTITLNDRKKMTACVQRLMIEEFRDYRRKHLTK